MKAFITFLVFTTLFVVAAMLATATGFAPAAKPITLWLVLVSLLIVGTKFVVADVLSSDGFQLNKASTDICLTALGAIASLAVVQTVDSHAIFDGPARFLLNLEATASPTLRQALVAGWLLTFLAFLFFLICLGLARWGRTKGVREWKKIVSSVMCPILGGFSFSSYMTLIFFKA